MTKGDQLIERGANRLQELSRQAAAKGGLAAKFADDLAEDAAFLRKLKPSLIKARAKGRAPTNTPTNTPANQPTNEQPAPEPPPAPAAPSSPQLGERPKPKKKRRKGGGPNPFVVAGAALAVGIVLAKVIDWRGHAHPRD